jgi:hypothetical protein
MSYYIIVQKFRFKKYLYKTPKKEDKSVFEELGV